MHAEEHQNREKKCAENGICLFHGAKVLKSWQLEVITEQYFQWV